MPYPHSIRLRGPWHFEPVARSIATAVGETIDCGDDLPPAGRSTVPSDWGDTLGAGFRGRVRYRRSFNPPSTLEPHERLWLVVEGVDAHGVVSLNGARLGEVAGYAIWSSFNISDLVGPRNEVVIDVELPESGAVVRPGREKLPGGPIGEVRLEVRSQRSIQSLAIWSLAETDGPRFSVSARIAGEPTDAPLAVVVGGSQHELAYIEVRGGELFESTFEASDFPVWTPAQPTTEPIEVKLLEGGESIWQHVRPTAIRGETDLADAVRIDQVRSDAEYLRFDRDGRSIIQQMPLEWAEHVCSRLAHHPCIAAWSAGPNRPSPQIMDYGRPWI
jgi:hypothetical protein